MKRSGKNVVLSPFEFMGQQILLIHPLLLPVWIAGLVSFFTGRGKRLRVLGWTYLVLLAIMIALKAKNYYLAPIYPMLLASGAVAIEAWLERRTWSSGKLWPRAAISAYVFAGGCAPGPRPPADPAARRPCRLPAVARAALRPRPRSATTAHWSSG